jgi:hypothetical protein
MENQGSYHHENAVASTASWLDRAKTVLNDQEESQLTQNNLESVPKSELVNQLHEVERLIYEGPRIQRSSAGIPVLLDQPDDQRPDSPASCTESEPADKRLRTGAEDAEALVGFLRSVRASAASAQDF